MVLFLNILFHSYLKVVPNTVFCKENETIELIPKINGKDHYFTRLDMDLLQAINQQINELGWNDITVNFDVKLDGKKVMEAMKGGNRKD